MNQLKQKLNHIKCFLLDMDGTIYLDNQFFKNVPETLKKMKQTRKVIFLTNNSSKSSQDYADKLQAMGLKTCLDEIYTSGEATIEFLKQHFFNKRVFLMGTRTLKKEFIDQQIVLDDIQPEVLVLGYDKEMTYEKLCRFTDFLHQNIPYIATHPDINCPSSPYFVPDIGAIMKMIEVSTGRTPDMIIGKPYPTMGEHIMKKYQLKADEIAMIGDRLYTDIAFAKQCGFLSILVLSGETKMEDYEKSAIQADLVIPSISDLYDDL